MTTINKEDRRAVKHAVLSAAFEPRFNAVQAIMRAHLLIHVESEHPQFVRLYKAKENRPYLQVARSSRFTVPSKTRTVIACRPRNYGEASEAARHSYVTSDENLSTLVAEDIAIPGSFGREFSISDANVIAEYDAVWKDLQAAYYTLSQLLASYKVREKFEKDFPELAKHLPEARQVSRMPAVIVKDVRADLAKFGIPASNQGG